MTRARRHCCGVGPSWNSIAAVLSAVAAFGCKETPSQNAISQFDRPQDAALVCCSSDESGSAVPLPLGCCSSKGRGVAGYCGAPDPTAKIFAFVTQTTSGEVAVVDLESEKIVDQDPQIPFNSFIPVGGQPSDIAASWDGTRVYTVNYETGDLSVINVAESFGPVLKPALSIDLGGPCGRIALSRHTEQAGAARDRFAFVTQPTLGRLAVVALNKEDCPDPKANPYGCLLGYLRIDTGTGLKHSVDDPKPDGVKPWSIVSSEQTTSIFVSGIEGDFILEIDGEILAEKALNLASPGPLDARDIVVRRISTDGFTTRALALEPGMERWLYAVENELGGVIVLDVVTGEMVAVNREDPVAKNEYSIDLPGRARTVALVAMDESDEPGPLTFDGTFAVVSTTSAGIFVIDVDDLNAGEAERHRLRSAVDLSDEENMPGLVEDPVLLVDDAKISEGKADSYAYIAGEIDTGSDIDAGVGECGDDQFKETGSYGFRFRCDSRQSSNEEWTLTWQGEVGISGVGIADYDSSSKSLLVVDERKNFCANGLNAGIYLPDDYAGDLLVITSDPTPAEGADCSDFEDTDLVYQIKEVVDDHTIRISNKIDGSKSLSPMPTIDCFGQAFLYEIRAFKHWILKGSKSGNLYDTAADPVTGKCIVGEGEANGFAQRVYPGVEFANLYFAFTLEMGDEKAPDGMYFSFATEGGFEGLSYVVGNDISDIEFTPDFNLILVDQAGRGLIKFDMADSFKVVGESVN